MNCLTEEIAMLYADREMSPAEAFQVEAHLPECVACRDLIATLTEENAALASYFQAPLPNRRLTAFSHLAGSIAASITIAVPLQWVVAQVSQASVWVNYVASLPFEAAFRAVRAFAPLMLLLIITQAMSFGMTRRTSQGPLVIPSQETIADSVLATGETVLVEGKIEGNLFMFGRSVEIRGEVIGDVFAGAQEVRITGHVTGNVMAGAETITVSGQVGGSLYAGGRNVHVDKGARVDLEVLAGAETIAIDGAVGRSLTAGAQSAVIAGEVGRGITFGGNKVLVRSGGKVGGDIKAEVPDRNSVQVDPGATVAGKVDVSIAERETSNPWARPGTYIWEVAVLAGAFLVGWLLMHLYPAFFTGTLHNVRSWASAGTGVVALIVVPVAAVVLCVTLIGLPMAIGSVFLYVTGLYLAKIFVAAYLGREIMGGKNGNGLPTLLGLLVGLVILQAVFFVPYAGGLLKFAVLCLGLGAVILQVRRQTLTAAAQ